MIRENWADKYGNGVTERWGQVGSFGYHHHVVDHNLGAAMVREVTQHPDSRNRLVSGQKYEWTNTTYRLRCGEDGCQLIDKRNLLVSVDYRMLSDNHNFGVVTGFCVGEAKCPDWVDARN